MKKIIKQLAVYFGCMGLSCLIGWLGIMEQPAAFFWLHILALVLITIVVSIKEKCNVCETLMANLVTLFFPAITLIPLAIIAWILHMNFFIVFEVYACIAIFIFRNKYK